MTNADAAPETPRVPPRAERKPASDVSKPTDTCAHRDIESQIAIGRGALASEDLLDPAAPRE
jgi:hypothetical protein